MQALQHIRHFTAANPGYMTLQGTNQYLLGRDEISVIDVALEPKDLSGQSKEKILSSNARSFYGLKEI
jgi:hypothetical protein